MSDIKYIQLSDIIKENKLKEIDQYLDDINNLQLIHLEFIMTNRCNGQCDYCFEIDQMKQRGKGIKYDITWEIMINYINLVRKNRQLRHIDNNEISRIIFFGGEPLLKKDLIIKCLNECQESFWSFSIISNGSIGWDDTFINLCYQRQINIQISLDGNYSSNKHRKLINNTPMFYSTYKTLLKLKNYPDILISSVVSLDNIQNIYDNFCFLEQLNIKRVQFFLDRIHTPLTSQIEEQILNQFILIGTHICNKIKNKEENYALPLGTLAFLTCLKNDDWKYPKPKRLFEQPDGLSLYIVSPKGDILYTTNEIMSSYQNIVGKYGITKESVLAGIKQQFSEPREYLDINICNDCICKKYHFPQCEQNLILTGCFKPTCYTFRGECLIGLMMIETMKEELII